MSSKDAAIIAQALAPAPLANQPANPYLPNPQLEQQVAPVSYPVHPLILALAQKLGMTNLMRNTQNSKEAVLQAVDQVLGQ